MSCIPIFKLLLLLLFVHFKTSPHLFQTCFMEYETSLDFPSKWGWNDWNLTLWWSPSLLSIYHFLMKHWTVFLHLSLKNLTFAWTGEKTVQTERKKGERDGEWHATRVLSQITLSSPSGEMPHLKRSQGEKVGTRWFYVYYIIFMIELKLPQIH